MKGVVSEARQLGFHHSLAEWSLRNSVRFCICKIGMIIMVLAVQVAQGLNEIVYGESTKCSAWNILNGT